MTSTKSASIPLAITMGDPAGIGSETLLKAWLRRHTEELHPFFVIDDPSHLTDLAQTLELDIPIKLVESTEEAIQCFATNLPVIALPQSVLAKPGHPDPINAKAVLSSIEMAVELVMRGDALALVTNPIHKEGLYEAGFAHPGHTEFLAHLAGISSPPVMMLASEHLRVIPITIHISISQAISSLNEQMIVEIGKISADALVNDFGISKPHLAVAGLNPHAGEGGAMGSEDIEIIMPAIQKLCELGINATGPYPPDTLFTARHRKTYDAALCMYHDQALIPIKTLDFDEGVNITLGLPFIRTSPDHGTAFNIAGTGTADETSLVNAMKTAKQLAHQRSGLTN